MAFTVPSFNLTAGVWSGPWLTKVHRFDMQCNLAFGRRVQQQYQDAADPMPSAASFQPLLLCPALTDLRSGVVAVAPDVIEVPLGSGRWYGVFAVEDVGKGFPNEYRAAVVTQISSFVNPADFSGLFWPVPVP